jgi:outer membrane protein assembly factor BamB
MKRSIAFYSSFLVFFLLFQTVFVTQAANHRQDIAQTGSTTEIIKPPVQTVWIELVGATKSYPAVVGEKLFIGTTWGLVCYNAKWGTKIWQFISKDFHHSSPAIYEGLVYAGAQNFMYCVDSRTGGLKWKFETPKDSANSSPIAHNGRIYFASGKRLYSLDAQNGKNLWSIGFPENITRPVAIAGERFFVVAGDRIYGFDLAKHTKIWEFQVSNIVKYGITATQQHVYVSVDRDLYKIDARNGKIVWKTFFPGIALNPVSVFGNEIYASYDIYFYSINQSNGRIKWQFEAGFTVESAPVISERYIWIGSDDFNIYCLDRLTGKRLYFAVAGSTSYYMTTGNQYLYSLSVYGELFCFMPSEQRKKETITIELWIGKSYARLNGQFTGIDTAPFIQDGSTMVPIRSIADFLKADLRWIAEEKRIVYSIETRLIQLWVGKIEANVNGKPVKMTVAPVIVNGRTYIPLRFVSENLGARVNWDSQEKKITIEYFS